MSFGGGGGGFSFGNAANSGGSNQAPKPTGFSFGGAASNNTQQTSGSTAPTTGFSFGGGAGQPLGGSTSTSQQTGNTGNAFSFGSGGSGNLFGGAAAAGSTTPASKPAFSFGTPATSGTATAGAQSTTPAAAPPANLFAGFGKPAAPAASSGSLFGQPSSSKPAESSAPAATAFSGFGAPQSNTTGTTSAPTSGFSLGATPSTKLTPSSGSTSAQAPAPAAPASKPAAFSFNTSTTPASVPSFSFGGAKPAGTNATSSAAPSSGSTATAASPFSFGASAPAASSSTTTASTAAPSSQPAPTSLFSGFKTDNKDKPAADGAAPKPATPFAGFGASSSNANGSAPATGGLFGAPKSAAPASGAAAAATIPAPAATASAPAPAPAPAGGLFAGFGKPAGSAPENKTQADTTQASTSATATSVAPPAMAASSTPASVSLPAPSMLRGRNMEEIVNKWTQELENATVEFTRQAAEVAVWDGVLRRGGDEIARLIQSLQAAEERQSSIEQTLDYVEQQQADLTSLLDGYEVQVAELLQGATTSGINAYGSQGVTRSMETGAADAERERAYAMAESLNSQLDELSSNLSSMIVEVNNLSSSTAAARPQAEPDTNAIGPLRLGNKLHNSGADPVSQIVAILNAHLGSLKWIDESTIALREKVENLRRGQIGGEARNSRDRVTSSPNAIRQEGGLKRSGSRNRQSSVAATTVGSNDTLRGGSVGPGYIRGDSVGRNAGSGWSEATLSTGGGSNLGRSRGYGL